METPIDWSNLDACGCAEHIPELLRELEASHDPEILDELWESLYYQGSVFSASFAALPDLVRIAEKWHYSERLGILSLAVVILSSEDPKYIANLPTFRQGKVIWIQEKVIWNTISTLYQREIETLLQLIEEDLKQPNLSTEHFIRLLGNKLALKGYVLWQTVFQYFALPEYGFDGHCVNCDANIEIYTTENSGIAELIETSSEHKKQTILQSTSPELLTGIAKLLYETARDRGFNSVAQKVTYILASGLCPNCGTQFQVLELLKFTEIIS